MELRVLRYFLMAAREENMTKAAELLHVTQPTLSRQIAAIYNLVNNGLEMVRSGIGALLCFPIRSLDPGVKFIPLYPAVETGSVLVWRRNQVLSQTAHRFLEEFKKYVVSISDDKN